MCRDGKLEESLLKATSCVGLKCAKERALHLVEDVEVNDAQVVHPNDCFVPEVQHHHGSQLLAAEMNRWLSESIWVQKTADELTSFDYVHPHFAYNVHAPVKVADIGEKGSCPTTRVPLCPCWSVVIAASETGVSSKTGVRDGLVPMDQRWVQCVNKLLPMLKYGILIRIMNFHYTAEAKLFQTAGLSVLTMHPASHIARVRVLSTLKEMQK